MADAPIDEFGSCQISWACRFSILVRKPTGSTEMQGAYI